MLICRRFAVRSAAVLLAVAALLWAAQFVAGPHGSNASVLAAELYPIQLPKPEITGGMPLMQVLSARKTTRAFRDKPLSLQTLSNLL